MSTTDITTDLNATDLDATDLDATDLNAADLTATKARCIAKITEQLAPFGLDSLPVVSGFLADEEVSHTGSLFEKDKHFIYNAFGYCAVSSGWLSEQLSLNDRLELNRNHYDFYDRFLLFPVVGEVPSSVTLYIIVDVPKDTETLRKFVDGERVVQRELDGFTSTAHPRWNYKDMPDVSRTVEMGYESIFIPVKTVPVQPSEITGIYTFSLYEHPLATNAIPFAFLIEVNYATVNADNREHKTLHAHVLANVYECSGMLYGRFQRALVGAGSPYNKMAAMRFRFPHFLASGYG